jgi:uncharacterized repeat protein (TIGR03806 family)
MKYYFLIFYILGVFISCRVTNPPVTVNISEPAFEKLSDYHFFTNPYNNLQPNDQVLPYDLITPLFSDYALKARFVWMPEGTAANLRDDGDIDFPEGAVLIKNFYYENPAHNGDKKIVETRLLIKRPKGWDPLTYVWDDQQADATLSIIGDLKKVSGWDQEGEEFTIDYLVPNKNQCKGCHERDRKIVPIGPKSRNLNKEFSYPDGLKNQLQKWADLHYLEGYKPNSDVAKFARWDDPSADLSERALAYLEVNCGTCHNPSGPAYVSGLYLQTAETNPFNLGICKAPVSAGKGSGGHQYDIVPGHPEKSILVYRMETTEPGAMMPEVGRKLVHKEGVQLIKDWISTMEGQCE